VRLVAMETKSVLDDMHLVSFPKTSGSRGLHINVPVHPSWTFTEVRRAALALARAVERRVPDLASSKWWKEERHGVFLDYNQNAKDRTTASAYSVRPLPDARVSAPLRWDEVADCDPADFTVNTMPARFEKAGDPHGTFRGHAGSLESLLQLAARDEAEGLGDAPWPPHFRKAPDEAPRVAPSRARKLQATTAGPTVAKVPRAKMPMLTIANSPDRKAALAGLERWRIVNPDASSLLAVDDVLVDRMRGRSYVWYRIRVNLRHVPERLRPTQQTPDPDDDPTRAEAKQK
jgi:bifunctional non-homologous end joining protein LigD